MSLKVSRLAAIAVALALISPRTDAAQDPAIPFQMLADSQPFLKALLPAAPLAQPHPMSWNNDDLTQVPEVQLNKAWSVQGSREWTARQIAGINFVNAIGADHFTRLLREHRPDLAGLPFILGDASRLEKAEQE